MVTFVCPQCGRERSGQRRRCYPCSTRPQSAASNERRRLALLGHVVSEETRAKIAAKAGGYFALGERARGKVSANAAPIGTERQRPHDGRFFVKVSLAGTRYQRWARRSHVVWSAVNGPVPRGRLIHHINEDPADDRLENLQLVTRAEHARIHHAPFARERQALGVKARKARRLATGEAY